MNRVITDSLPSNLHIFLENITVAVKIRAAGKGVTKARFQGTQRKQQ